MKKISRPLLACTLTLIMLVASCAPQGDGTPIVVETIPGILTDGPPPALETETALTTATPETTASVDLTGTVPATSTTQTPSIPVTGADTILLECQFCIEDMAHTLLVFPDTLTFELVTPATTVTELGLETGCNIVDAYNGKQVVLCRAKENTSLILSICTNANNCTELAVDLQNCPDSAGPRPGATSTREPDVPTDTPPADLTSTPVTEVPANPTSTPVIETPTAIP